MITSSDGQEKLACVSDGSRPLLEHNYSVLAPSCKRHKSSESSKRE